MTTHEIIGKPVVSMADGTKIGDVSDILIDPASYSALTLVIHGDRRGHHLAWSSIKNIGKDAITIESSELIQDAPKTPDTLRSYKDLEGVSVVDGEGSSIGTVHEMMFDESGCIKTIDTRLGGVFGIGAKDNSVMIDEVRSIGPKLITVERAPV